MKKICISIAVFLAVFMTGCETYEDNLRTSLTETTPVSETASPAFEEITETTGFEDEATVTTAVSGETSDETGIGTISLDYDAIATAVSETETTETETGITTGISNTGEYSSEDGRPPLPDDLKDFYTSALEVYSKIYYCSFTSDTSTPVWVDGKNGYTRVTDTRFPDYQSLYSFASYYFTDELMSTKILPYGQTDFVEKYSAFYMAPASNVKNPAYAGHVFKLTSQSDTEIVCTADVYYLLASDSVNTDPIFYTEPADKSKYAVSQVSFKLTSFEDRWKFSDFSVIN